MVVQQAAYAERGVGHRGAGADEAEDEGRGRFGDAPRRQI